MQHRLLEQTVGAIAARAWIAATKNLDGLGAGTTDAGGRRYEPRFTRRGKSLVKTKTGRSRSRAQDTVLAKTSFFEGAVIATFPGEAGLCSAPSIPAARNNV